jgi:CheY-like chemotaxis protein
MHPQILIVDDEEAVSSMLKVVFETDGYEVTTAASAAAASAQIAKQIYDVVLTDMKMESDTAGYEVVHAARQRSDRTIIVILTAFPLLAKDWRAAGAEAALSKPSNMLVMLETVRELLEHRRQRSTRIS